MTRQLITSTGKRKYLTQDERERFLAAAAKLDRGEVRTLCMTLAYFGCRISEALECDAARVDFSGKAITFRTLKQRGKDRYRAVPIPGVLLSALDDVHGIRRAQKRKQRGKGVMLWSWGRTQVGFPQFHGHPIKQRRQQFQSVQPRYRSTQSWQAHALLDRAN